MRDLLPIFDAMIFHHSSQQPSMLLRVLLYLYSFSTMALADHLPQELVSTATADRLSREVARMHYSRSFEGSNSSLTFHVAELLDD